LLHAGVPRSSLGDYAAGQFSVRSLGGSGCSEVAGTTGRDGTGRSRRVVELPFGDERFGDDRASQSLRGLYADQADQSASPKER
jgi:hypothetical protein